MKSLQKSLLILCILLVIAGVNYYLTHSSQPSPITAPLSPTLTTVLGVQATPSTCHTDGTLPDTTCTPGAIDPSVTQDNIYQTICERGYTTTVRPPVSYTNELKRQQITAYGYTDTNPTHYEEDHLISLELGGSPTDPKNLWPEPGASPNPKDKIENVCHEKVCNGELPLAKAQEEIASNWTTACQ